LKSHFSSKQNLDIHFIEITGEKPCYCPESNQLLTTKENLDVHFKNSYKAFKFLNFEQKIQIYEVEN